MKIEQAKELAEKALAQLALTLEQGHSDELKKYLAAMAKFPRYSVLCWEHIGECELPDYVNWKKKTKVPCRFLRSRGNIVRATSRTLAIYEMNPGLVEA